MSGKNLIKWDRMRETNADEEDEECEQNEEEYTDEAEKLQQELIDGQEDDDSAGLIFQVVLYNLLIATSVFTKFILSIVIE